MVNIPLYPIIYRVGFNIQFCVSKVRHRKAIDALMANVNQVSDVLGDLPGAEKPLRTVNPCKWYPLVNKQFAIENGPLK
jgi:hypothetical protein